MRGGISAAKVIFSPLYAFVYIQYLYAFAYINALYAVAYIDNIYSFAYITDMNVIIRTTAQIGSTLRRIRRQQGLTQGALGEKIHARQATISKLEAGEPTTQLRILMDALAALDLELVVQPRSKGTSGEIEDNF